MSGTSTTDRARIGAGTPPAGSARPTERSDVPSPWVVALAPLPVLVAALAMRPLVQGSAWWLSGVVFTAVLVAVVLAVRRRAPGVRFIALVATLVVGSCVAAVVNDVHPLGWLDREGALGEALAAIRLNPAPLPQTDAIRLVVTIAIAWVAGVSLFLAAIAPTVALAAVPALVVLIVPGVVTGEPASPVLVVLVGAAFLGLLWLSVRPVQRAFPAAVVGAIGLVVAVGLPALVPLNASWLSGVTGALQSPIQPGRPGTLLELGRDLRQPNEIEVLRYRTADGQPEYLKLADLDEFGSGDWVPTVTDASTSDTADQQQWAVGVNPRLASRGDLTVRITGLSSNYLPVPAGAVSLESQSTNLDLSQWRWMGDSSTVRSTGPSTQRGSTYQAFGASTSSGSTSTPSRRAASSDAPTVAGSPRRATRSSAPTCRCRRTCRATSVRRRSGSRAVCRTTTPGPAHSSSGSGATCSRTPRRPPSSRATTATAWTSSTRSCASVRGTACTSRRRWR